MRAELKCAVFLESFDNPVVDQIFRLERFEFFMGRAAWTEIASAIGHTAAKKNDPSCFHSIPTFPNGIAPDSRRMHPKRQARRVSAVRGLRKPKAESG
jgi:hypothetical protein